MEAKIPMQTLQRLPLYLTWLKDKHRSGAANISAGAIAAELGLVEIQVRKDLACVSSGGKPRIGYLIGDLITDIESALGYNNINEAVLVGAGRLGKALMGYEGFREYGLRIVAAFDTDESEIGTECGGTPIFPMEKLTDLCKRMNIRIGIITVPASHAQEVCDRLVESGVVAVWNFAPTHLKAPDHILIRSENMAASLAILSNHLNEQKYTD